MTDSLQARGPDAEGFWIDDAAQIGLGHRRLSVVDLSEAGAQPMQSQCGRFVITYNGELYNTASLRANVEDLRKLNWRGHSDTEVLLELIAARGLRPALELADGMFALAVFDRRTRNLMLARDSFGEKPLYYGFVGGQLVFASQLGALTQVPGFEKRINPSALARYFQRSYIPAPQAIYEGVRKLPPAHLLCITPDDLKTRQLPAPETYWDAQAAALQARAQPFGGSFEDAVGELGTLFSATVRSRTIADVPLGCLLSGGIDSSAVAAMMARTGTAPKTFCIGMTEDGFNEADQARAVAAHLGCDHTELMLTPQDFLDAVPRLPGIYDEPFSDSSQVPTLLVSELARRDVTVALTGDGGDEIFAGYNRYVFGPKLWSRTSNVPLGLRSIAACALRRPVAGTLAGLVLPGLAAGRARENLAKFAAVLPARSAADLYARLIATGPQHGTLTRTVPEDHDFDPELFNGDLGFAEAAQLADTVGYLPGDILAKVDRASMSQGLETRAPFLSRDIFAFAWSLPPSFKTDAGQGKRVLRALLYQNVPQGLVDRPKSGFAVPVGRWLRGPLREWAQDLMPRRDDDLLDGAAIARLWDAHLSGRAQNDTALWSVLMFQSWRAQA